MPGASEPEESTQLVGEKKLLLPFVGRKHVLHRLEDYLKESLDGHPQVILLQGEAGVGKTRLLKELRALALHSGMEACYGRCHEDLTLPYLPFVESLLVRLATLPEGGATTLAEDVAVIKNLFRANPGVLAPNLSSLAQGDQAKLRLFLAASRATIALAQLQPTLLVVDDLHWADQPSLELFSHFVFTIADAAEREKIPLVIIGSHRPVGPEERLARAISRFQREQICHSMELTGLDEVEVTSFVQNLGIMHPSHQLVSTLSKTTKGNPLFVQEVLFYLQRQNALENRGEYVATTASSVDIDLPDQVTTAIIARIQTLSEKCRQISAWASCLGESFSLEVLRAVSAEDESILLDLLEEGMSQRLFFNEGQSFQFAHPLIQHVCYHSQSVPRRQQRHLLIAETMEQLNETGGGYHLLEIAHHLICAGPKADVCRVAKYTRQAGHVSFSISAWGEAARYYEVALAAEEQAGILTDGGRGELHYLAGYSHYRNMDIGPCLDHYEKSIAAYQKTDDLRGLALVLKEHVGAHFTLASVPYGTLIDVKPLEAVIVSLGEGELSLQGQLWAKVSQAYWHARQLDNAEATARRALQIGQQIGDDALCAEANVALALAQTQGLRLEEALLSWRESLAAARRAADLWRQGWPLQRMPLTLIVLGRLDEAEAIAKEAQELVRQTHDWSGASMALAALTFISVVRGDFFAAERNAYETMQMVRRSRYPWGGAIALPALGTARFLRGLWNEAEDTINLLVEPQRVFTDPGTAFQAGTLIYRELIRLQEVEKNQGGPLSAKPPKTGGQGHVDIDSLARLCAWVEIVQQSNIDLPTEHLYQPLFKAAARGVVFSRGWIFLISRILGVIATLNRWWEKASSHLRDAIEIAERLQVRPELGRSYLDYARMLIERNEKGDAAYAEELIERAVRLFDQLTMTPLGREARLLAETSRSPLSQFQSQVLSSSEILNDREEELFRQLARQRTDLDIAEELLLTPSTVTTYVESLCRKLKVDSRTDLLARVRTRKEGSQTGETTGVKRSDSLVSVKHQQSQEKSMKQESNVFRREGSVWLLSYKGITCRLKDMKGLHYIAFLLRYPEKDISALQMTSVVGKSRRASLEYATSGQQGLMSEDMYVGGISGIGSALDQQALGEYQQSLRELKEELEEAVRFNDLGKIERCQAEIEFLTGQLKSAKKLGKSDSLAERARLSVTKAIVTALRQVQEHHPLLWQHFHTAIKTGTSCSYRLDPTRPSLSWDL